MDSDALVQQAAFVRRLALSLVRNRDAASDLAQGTLIEALRHPPRPGYSLASWLTGILRNLVCQQRRAEDRRHAREQMSVTCVPAISPVDAAARIEIMARVVEALQQLAPSSRDILVLRFLEDLPPREIAKRLQLPIETARTRIKRALDQMRTRLDERHDGRRDRWCALLLPLIPSAAPATSLATPTAALEAILMISKIKLGLVAIGSLAVAILLSTWHEGGVQQPPAHSAARTSPTPANEPTSLDATPASDALPGRSELGSAPATFRVRGIAHDPWQRPGADLALRATMRAGFAIDGAVEASATITTDKNGVLSWSLPPPQHAVTLSFAGDGITCVLAPHPHRLEPGAPAPTIELEVFPIDGEVRGRVLDTSQRPIADAIVSASTTLPKVTCNQSGDYAMRVPTSLASLMLTASAPGHSDATEWVDFARGQTTNQCDFHLLRGIAVTGFVRDEGGSPITGASVRNLNAMDAATRSDTQGRYRLDGIDQDQPQARMLTSADGFASREVVLTSPMANATLDITLLRGATLRGHVEAHDGTSVAGAEVWLGSHRELVSTRRVWANQDGRFEIRNVAPGPAHIGAERAGHSATELDVEMPARGDLDHVVLRLPRGHVLTGRVTDIDGKRIQGVRVTIGPDARVGRKVASTDADGNYRFDDAPPTISVVTYTRRGYVADFRAWDPSQAETRFDDVRLAASGVVRGRVVDARTGTPLKEFRVRAQAGGYSPPSLGLPHISEWYRDGRRVRSADGTFEVLGDWFAVGTTASITITATDYAPAQVQAVARDPDTPAELEVTMVGGHSLRGRVQDPEGRPIAGADVRVVPATSADLDQELALVLAIASARTDALGDFVLSDVSSGDVQLLMTHPGFVTLRHAPLALTASELLDPMVMSRGAELSGVVRDERGAPQPGVLVGVRPLAPTRQQAIATTDERGHFAIRGLAPGKWYACVWRAQGRASTDDCGMVIDVHGDHVEIELGPRGTATVRGRVHCQQPLPASSWIKLFAVEAARDELDEPMPVRSVFASEEGAFEIRGVAAGRYRVVFAAMNEQSKTIATGEAMVDAAADGVVEVLVTAHPSGP